MNPAEVYVKATFWERLAAMIIDELILVIPIILAQLGFSRLFPTLASFSFTLEIVIYATYNVFLLTVQGATIGKKLMGIKVVTNSYEKVKFPSVFLRETIAKWLSRFVFELGYLWVLIDDNNQAWHDKLAHTYAIKVDKSGNPLPGKNPGKSPRDRVFFFLFLFLFGIPLMALPLFVFFYLFVGQPLIVRGGAMEPTLKNNEYILTSKFAYNSAAPKRGDIIVFESPKDPGVEYIKRVIGLPGDRVTILDGAVYLNAEVLDESYLAKGTSTKIFSGSFMTDGVPVIVPAENYFVLGDNREHSSDSRDFGFVPQKNIEGKYWFTYWRS